MGVELGKVLAKNILSQLEKPEDVKNHDSSVCHSLLSFISSLIVLLLCRQPASSTITRSTAKNELLFILLLNVYRRYALGFEEIEF